MVFAVVFEEIEETVIFSFSEGRRGRSLLPDSISFTSGFKFCSVEVSTSALLSLGGSGSRVSWTRDSITSE